MGDSAVRSFVRLFLFAAVGLLLVIAVEFLLARLFGLAPITNLTYAEAAEGIEKFFDPFDPDRATRNRLSDLWSGLEVWLTVFVAIFGIGFTIDQANVLRNLDERLFPRQPEFLAPLKRPKGERFLRRSFVGREDLLKELRAFALDHDRNRIINRGPRKGLAIDGIVGKRGIGKTRLAQEWCWELSKPHWRWWRQWHVGRIKYIDSAWRPRRPTAILITGDGDRDLFWEILKDLSNRDLGKPVRILIDCDMDYDLMIEGHYGQEVELLEDGLGVRASESLKEFLALGTEEAAKAEQVSTTDRPLVRRIQADQSASDEESTQADSKPMKQIDSIFLRVKPLDGPDSRTLVGLRIGLGDENRVGLIVGEAQGRPKYLERLSEKTNLSFKQYVDREDARALILEAVKRCPEEALPLVTTAALGIGEEIPSEVRRRVAPGANDRRRLARIFRNDVSSEWRLNKADLAPVLRADREALARHILWVAMQRLQRADAEHIARRLLLEESGHDFLRNLNIFMKWSEWNLSLKWLLLEDVDSPVTGRVIERFKEMAADDPIASFEPHDQTRTVLRVALGASRGSEITRRLHQYLVSLLPTQQPEVRADILRNFAELVGSRGNELGDVFKLFAADPEWAQSAELVDFLEQIYGAVEVEEDPWANLIDDPAPLEIAPNPRLADAAAGLAIMDRFFSAENASDGKQPALEDSERALLARLLRSQRSIDRLAGAWSAFWIVNPTALRDWHPLSTDVVEELERLAQTEPSQWVWARTVGTLAKLKLGQTGEKSGWDHLYDWAVIADTLNTKIAAIHRGEENIELPAYLVPLDPVPVARFAPSDGEAEPGFAQVAMMRAKRVLQRPDDGEQRADRRYAALFLLAFEEACSPECVAGMIEAVVDPYLVQAQRATMVFRLVQARQWTALAQIVQSDNEDAALYAYLALVAHGRINLVPLAYYDDLQLENDRRTRDYLVLRGMHETR